MAAGLTQQETFLSLVFLEKKPSREIGPSYVYALGNPYPRSSHQPSQEEQGPISRTKGETQRG